MKQNSVLTIAGSDPSGGAGIQADLKTIEAHNLYGMSIITALTAQSTQGISGILSVDSEFIKKQLISVCEDILPDAVKIGMLPNIEAMKEVIAAIDSYALKNIVLDPVLSSTSGTRFSKSDAVSYMKKELFPRCRLITPNIPEAEILSGMKINSEESMEKAAESLAGEHGCNVLLKGGHSSFFKEGDMTDLLCEFERADNRITLTRIKGKRIDNPNTHGTGCTLSSAIACNLAVGMSLKDSVTAARKYMERCIAAGLDIGHGRGPLYHRV